MLSWRNTDFCADRICMSPSLGMTTSLTGGEQLGSFGRRFVIILWMRSGFPGRTQWRHAG